MLLKVLVVAAVGVTALLGWPISPLEDYATVTKLTKTPTCGEVDLTEQLQLDEYLRLTFDSDLQDLGDNRPCVIQIRIDVMDRQTEKYGLWVSGNLNMSDSASDTQCSSSYLSVADQDTEDDEMGRLVKYCGQEQITFHTREDVINIELHLTKPSVNQAKFTLEVRPHFFCGGTVDEESDVSTPDYPEPYDKDFVCLWIVKPPQSYSVELEMHDFDLRPPHKKRGCFDYLQINFGQKYCGHDYANTTKLYKPGPLTLVFQSTKWNKIYKGFRCSIKFRDTRNKASLMAKFFT